MSTMSTATMSTISTKSPSIKKLKMYLQNFVKEGTYISVKYYDVNGHVDWYSGKIIHVNKATSNFIDCSVLFEDGDFVEHEYLYYDQYNSKSDDAWKLDKGDINKIIMMLMDFKKKRLENGVDVSDDVETEEEEDDEEDEDEDDDDEDEEEEEEEEDEDEEDEDEEETEHEEERYLISIKPHKDVKPQKKRGFFWGGFMYFVSGIILSYVVLQARQ